MSASDANVVGSEGDNDDEEDEYDVASIGKNRLHARTRCGGGFGKGLVIRQFAKAKSKLRRVRSKRALLSSSTSHSPSEKTTFTGSGKNKMMMNIRGDSDDRRNGCKFCFLQPKVLESLDGSPSSDPNHPNFTNSMLRVLIENNDFYSKDCNPHLD